MALLLELALGRQVETELVAVCALAMAQVCVRVLVRSAAACAPRVRAMRALLVRDARS